MLDIETPCNLPGICAVQVLFQNQPVALAGVDCDGTEASITECQQNDNLIGMCSSTTSSTVLACANSPTGAFLSTQSCRMFCRSTSY